MIDISAICYYIELQVKRDREQRIIKISQSAYIDKVA